MSVSAPERSVSVVITSHDQKAYLVEAIESVLAQTARPFEIIVVDDASSDGSQAVIDDYARSHPDFVVPVFRTENGGVAQARNSGIERVRARYVCVLDGDDRFLPRKLERELAALAAHAGAQIVYSNVWFVDACGQRLATRAAEGARQPSGDIFAAVFGLAFAHDGTTRNEIIPIDALRAVGLFDPRLVFFDDWDLRIRLTRRFRVAYCPEALVEYRRHSQSLSATSGLATLYWDMQAVIRKNRSLLAGLSARTRAAIRRGQARALAPLAYAALHEALEERQARRVVEAGLRYLRHDPAGFAAGLLRFSGSLVRRAG